MTKQNKSRISVTSPFGEYKLKEKYHVRLLDITDRDDTDGKCVVIVLNNCNFTLCIFMFSIYVFCHQWLVHAVEQHHR